MAQVSAAMVKELREMTGAGMMECKKALVEADGDMDKAVDVLRTAGLASVAKKAGRATNEGAVVALVSDDAHAGALVELNFEGETVEAVVTDAIHTLGENIQLARFAYSLQPEGAVASYVHGVGKIGVLVDFKLGDASLAANDAFKTYGRDIAMQVAAASPVAATREAVDPAVVAHEMEIYKAQAAESGKPENIQEKIATGRLEKFYKENVLTEQAYVKDPDKSVADYTAEVAKELGTTIEIVDFTRFVLGE